MSKQDLSNLICLNAHTKHTPNPPSVPKEEVQRFRDRMAFAQRTRHTDWQTLKGQLKQLKAC